MMRHTLDEGESSHSERENHYLPTLQSESHREEDKKHESFFQISKQRSIEHSFICSFCDYKEQQAT